MKTQQIVLFLTLFVQSLFAQNFQKIIYGGGGAAGTDAIQTPNGDYIVLGWSQQQGISLPDYVIVKYDALGNQVWQKMIGGTNEEFMGKLSPTADGKYVLVGKSNSFGNSSGGIFLYKFDENGTKIWSKFFESTDPTISTHIDPTSIALLADGGFLISGYHSGRQEALLLRTDSLGNFAFGRTYNNNPFGGSGNERANKVVVASDQNYVVTGYANVNDAMSLPDILLVKFDQQGDTIWSREFGGTSGWEVGLDMIETEDFGFVIVGLTSTYGAGMKDVIVVKTNNIGEVQWTQIFGGPSNDEAFGVAELPGGNLIIAGYTESFFAGLNQNRDIYFMKLDKNGNHIFTKAMDGGTENEDVMNSVRCYDDKIVLAGQVNGYSNIYLGVTDTSLSDLCNIRTLVNPPSTNLMITKAVALNTNLIFSNFTPLDTINYFSLSDSNLCSPLNSVSKPLMDLQTIEVYPNPTSGHCRIRYSGTIQNLSIQVFDQLGKSIFKQSSLEEIDLSRLERGIYFVSFFDGENYETRKILLQ